MPLPPGAWYPPHHAALTAFLERLSARPGRKVAVTDWDDTCVFRCLGTASFRCALEQLDLRMSPDELAVSLTPSWGGVERSVQGVDLAALRADVLELYERLWPWMREGRGAEARALHRQDWLDLRARLGFYYPALEETPGVGPVHAYGYLAWLTGAGRTEAELEALSERAWVMAAAEAPGEGVFRSARPLRSGHVSWSYETGLGRIPEMQALAHALVAAGAELWVVTASVEGAIRAGVRMLGYPVPPERVLGIRPAAGPGGVLQGRLVEGWPLTWRQGKVDVIREVIGAPPLYVAGDTNTDFEMLTAFPETELRILVERGSRGAIDAVRAHGRGEGSLPGITLVQGRDDNVSGFWPGTTAVKLGERRP
ncbi:MAG: haloacid dehalogenase-like hydrolase [Alphaproteobacteria bacterium]|nr:haloacid dehalogenase-like hydrolase [Alphaproteobacteria bacterium]